MLLHSLGELHKGTSWMTRGERMRTTLEPTLGGGGQIGEQVDRQGGGLLSFCRQTLCSCNMKVGRGGGIVIVNEFL